VGWLSVGTTDRHQKKSREVYFANGCCVGIAVLKMIKVERLMWTPPVSTTKIVLSKEINAYLCTSSLIELHTQAL
jgi:hypothetical protein